MEDVKILNTKKTVYAGLCLSIAIILPSLFGQAEVLGQTFLPMHFAIMLCGFLCGPSYAAIVGIISPYLRFLLFGTPIVYPIGISMSLELATYGIIIGYLFNKYRYKIFGFVNKKEYNPEKKRIFNLVILVLIITLIAMVVGRIVWGLTMYFLTLAMNGTFNFGIFFAGTVTGVIPGIIAQLILLPAIIVSFEKAKII